ncbi:replication-associated recombination protein A [Rufibacter glacialis]|uniref:Replication-associated recombination protein A n=1 Tax=Rufibacter glacialis TaxID=1259555 RepID=A0A5M8QBK3_9BACT|nr:replication-associated recombination protein A [Rufibacter glacialis]KAA6432260.1 replication-associated recombination protein A [Rufibacter glacialis]GGK77197.1 ATPase AAA [Rufibacter glacialis]
MFQTTKAPLPERMRPHNLDQYAGQKHLVGPKGVLRRYIEAGMVPSMIFWGPPGVGKTTLAGIIAGQLKVPFVAMSAINAGVKDIRDVIDQARKRQGTVLFIDEIHRFNKSQQDALLGAVEKGTVTLIGATTENPSFEVIPALLSRCQVYILKSLEKAELVELVQKALTEDEILKKQNIEVQEYEALLTISGGDARKLLNLLEIVIDGSGQTEKLEITNELVKQIAQQNLALYDKGGEAHYDIISAFIKSMRGSDPNATIYWLARMIEGGEDPKFIARRMLIMASEDIGNANPTAIIMANECFQAVNVIGYPECDIILSQCAIYLATSPKSNAAYKAIRSARALVREQGSPPVPLHLRNAPTKLMKEIGYGDEYKYAHDYEGNFVPQDFLPTDLKGTIFFNPGNNARENEMRKNLRNQWGDWYRY